MYVCVCVCVCLHAQGVQLFATPWTVAHKAPLSKGFSSQEDWNEVPFPSPGDLPDPGIEPASPASRWILYHSATWEAPHILIF